MGWEWQRFLDFLILLGPSNLSLVTSEPSSCLPTPLSDLMSSAPPYSEAESPFYPFPLMFSTVSAGFTVTKEAAEATPAICYASATWAMQPSPEPAPSPTPKIGPS